MKLLSNKNATACAIYFLFFLIVGASADHGGQEHPKEEKESPKSLRGNRFLTNFWPVSAPTGTVTTSGGGTVIINGIPVQSTPTAPAPTAIWPAPVWPRPAPVTAPTGTVTTSGGGTVIINGQPVATGPAPTVIHPTPVSAPVWPRAAPVTAPTGTVTTSGGGTVIINGQPVATGPAPTVIHPTPVSAPVSAPTGGGTVIINGQPVAFPTATGPTAPAPTVIHPTPVSTPVSAPTGTVIINGQPVAFPTATGPTAPAPTVIHPTPVSAPVSAPTGTVIINGQPVAFPTATGPTAPTPVIVNGPFNPVPYWPTPAPPRHPANEVIRVGPDFPTPAPARLPEIRGSFFVIVVARFDNLGGGWYQRVFDFGNGAGSDNVLLTQVGNSHDLALHVYTGSSYSTVTANGILVEGMPLAMRCGVDADATMWIELNGERVAEGPGRLPRNIARASQLIGESNWPNNTPIIGDVTNIQVINVP